MSEEQKIIALLKTHNKERVYQMDDGSIVKYEGGSASWRHNNPGNLKFEYANSADHTVHTIRTKEKALSDAQHRYAGIVALDQWGNAVFESYEAGRAAKIQLLVHQHGGRTVPEMLRKYSKPDYSGGTNWDNQEASIYKTADAQGVDLRGKKIGEMTSLELSALADGIKNFEGWKRGSIETIQAPLKENSFKPNQPSSTQESIQPSPHLGNYHHAGAGLTVKDLSERHQTLVTQSHEHIHRLYKEQGLPIDQGTQNTILSLAVAASERGMNRIDHAVVKEGNINVAQINGMVAHTASINGHVAANTPVEQSLHKLAELEQSQVQQMRQPSQQLEQPQLSRSMV